MNPLSQSFALALREARRNSGKTLRELAVKTGKAISYLSDLEQGRKPAPNLETVRIIQEFLNVQDERLVILASRERRKIAPRVLDLIQRKPALENLLMRAEEMDISDSQLEEILKELAERSKRNA